MAQTEADLDFAKFWAARQGRYQPAVGRVTGQLRAQRAEETLAGSFDWSLDQELRCSEVSLTQAGRPLPVLTLDKGRVGYAPAALEERGDVAAALDEVSLGSVWVQARRLADRSLELPALLSAYLPRGEAQSPRQPRFLGGLTAHLHADALSGTYEDLSLQPGPLQVALAGTSGDVYCDRLALLHEGREAAAPGGLKGAVSFTRGSESGGGSFDVDLSGRAGLSRVLVTSKGVAEPVVSLVEGTASFDPRVLLSDSPGLDGIGDVYLKQPEATISLDEQGRWALLGGVQGGTSAETGDHWALDRFVHRLTVVDGAVTYRDPRRLADYPLFADVQAAAVNGALDFAALWEARRTGIPRDPGTLSASLRLASADAQVTGALRTDLATAARLTSLECRAEQPARTLLSCPEATIEAPLSSWLLGKGSLGELKRVEAWDLQANLRREESGKLELLRVLGRGGGERRPGTTEAVGVGGALVLHQANLLYTDEALDVKGGVTVGGSGLDGELDLATLQAALKGEKAGPAGHLTGFLVGHYGVFQGAGSIDTDVTGHLQVAQLRVRKPETDETAVSADQLQADYDLGAMVRDRDLTSPLASVSADGLRAHVVRSPDGTLELAQGLRLTSAAEQKGPATRYTKLRLTRSSLQYTDYSRGRRTPLQAQAGNLDGAWDLAAWSAMQQDGQTRDCGFLKGDLQVAGESFKAAARVSSDLSRSATVEDLSFASSGDSSTESEHLRSARLQLAYDLGPVLQGQDWPQHLRQVTCDHLEGQLSRDAAGKIGAVSAVSKDLGLRTRSGAEGVDLTGLRARVVARDSRLVYRDEALLDVGPLIASLQDANLDVDLSTVGAAGQTPTQRPRGSLSAQVHLSTPGQEAEADLRGDLEGEIALRGLRVVQSGVQEPVLAARSLSMETDLQYLLASSPPIVSVVRALTVDGLGGSIKRDSRGVIVSPEFLSLRVRPAPGKPATPVRLAGVVNTRVTVRNSSLSLEDDALLGEEGPIRFSLQQVDGQVQAVGRVGGPIETWLKPEGKLSGVLTSETGQARLRTSFETDLASNLWLHGLESLAPDGQRLAQADEVHLDFSFDASSAGQSFARRLRAAKLDGVQIALASSPHGYLSVGGFPLRAVKMQGPSGTSFGEVSAVTGSVQTDKLGILRGSLQVRGNGGVVADALAQGSYDPVDGWLDLKATAREADLGLLGGLVLPASEGTVTARADHVTASAYGRPGTGDEQFTWAIRCDARDGQARLPGLTDETVHFSGPLRAGAEGVSSEKLQVAWGGVTGTAAGGVLDLSDPVLSLSLDLEAAQGSDLVNLLPPKERSRWHSIKLMDGARLHTSLCGSIRNANAEFRLQASGENLVHAGELGVVKVTDLDVVGSVLGFAEPSIRAEVTARQPGIQETTAAEAALPSSSAASAQTRLSLVTGADLEGVGMVEVPEADLLGVPIKDFAAQLALSQDKVQVVNAAGQIAHGKLTARGEAPFGSPEGFRVQGLARLEGAKLDTLQTGGLLPASLTLGGEVSATFTGTYGDKTEGYGVEVNVKSPVVKGQSFDSARLIATGKGRAAQIALLQLSDGPGQVCVRGSLQWPEKSRPSEQASSPDGGPVAHLELAAAEFDLSKLPLGTSVEPVAGRLYAGGSLQGSLGDPDVKLSLQAFDLAYEDRHADALTGRLDRRGGTLSVPRLLLSSGQAVLGLTDGRVDGFSLRSGKEPQRLAPDGRIRSALVRAFGPAEGFAPLISPGLSTDGWFSLTGAASGSLRRPVLTSMLHADTWRVGDFLLDEANLPFTLSGDTLLLTEGSARGYGGALTLTGRVDDVYSRGVYTLAGSMTGVSLEDLPDVEDLGQDIAGVVSLPQITVWGSRDSKPRSAVTFRVDGGRVGSEDLQPISGRAQFLDDVLRVDATKIRRADTTTPEMGLPGVPGYVTVEASYDIRSRFLDAVLRVAGEERVRRGTEPTARELTALPELGWLLRFSAPVVGAVEKRMSRRALGIGPGSTPGASEPPGLPVSERLRRLGLRTEGRLLGRVHLAGPLTALHCQAGVTLWDARLDGRALPEEMRVRLGADLAARRLYDLEAEAQDGRQYLTVTGDLDLPAAEGQATPDASPRRVNVSVEGADIDLPMWREWLPTPLPISGTATFTLVAAGSTESPTVKGSLDVMRPSYAGARFDVLNVPLIELSEGALRVTRARLLRSEEVQAAGQTERTRIAREVSMSGSLPWTWHKPWIPPDGPVSYQAELADLDLGFFPPILDEIARSQSSGPRSAQPTVWSQLQARGNVKARLNVTGIWSAPAVNGRLEIADGYLRAPGWQRAIDGTQVAIALERTGGHNRATVEKAQAQWGTVKLALHDGSAVIDHFGADELADNEFHGELVLSNDQITDVYGLSVGAVAGSVGFNTRPRQAGETGPRIHDLVFHDLTTQMGAGHVKLTGTGKLTNLLLGKLDTNEFDLGLVSDNADLRYGRQMRGKLNGAIRLHRLDSPPEGGGPEKQAHLDGTMALSQADLALAPPKMAEAPRYLGLSSRLPAPVMNVALNVGASVLLRGMGVTVPLATGPAAKITGTPQLPRIIGSLRAPEGAIRVPAGMIQVKTASITYALTPVPKALQQDRMPLELTGDVNIQGQRLITNAEVPGWGDTPLLAHIAVEGKLPSDLRVRVWSEPPLGEEQIIAMLGAEPLGGLVGQTEGGDTAVSQEALNLLTAGFRATIFEPIESELMRVLGLSEFDIRFGFDQELEFRLGKYVVKDLLASYQHHVGAAGDDRYQFSLAYRLKNRVHVAYTTNERNESRIKLTYDLMGRGSP
ncbi:translocation/assembly module TamB [bacterium]|nr:translocation/assembly module TamB [bacterium]